MVRIFCKNTGTYREYEEGTPLMDMVADFDFEKPWPILSARVNNVAQGLRFKVFNNRDVEFLEGGKGPLPKLQGAYAQTNLQRILLHIC